MSLGLTQEDLSATAGVSVGTLRDLEQGRTRCPRWGAVAMIASALGMDRHQQAELARAWFGGQPGQDAGYAATEEAEVWTCGPVPRIGVLGPLTAVRARAVIGLGSPRQRAVLGLLALHGTTGVSRDVIIDVLWGERSPRSATTQVQAYVSRLRQLLDPERMPHGRGGPVMLAGGYYRLAEGTGLDVDDFCQLSRRADVASGQGEFRLACLLYERALSLWRVRWRPTSICSGAIRRPRRPGAAGATSCCGSPGSPRPSAGTSGSYRTCGTCVPVSRSTSRRMPA
jgi:DNA-binding XRE family transcriptional regulator